MNIVFCSDSNYLPHLAAAIGSVLAHNSPADCVFYIILNQCSPEDIHTFRGSVKSDLRLIMDDSLSQQPLFVNQHVSITTYQRLFLDRLLPAVVDKYLYLDCDLQVTGSLVELYETPLGDHLVAAAPEYGNGKLFSFPAEGIYFNAGVMLVNRMRWQDEDLTTKLEDFVKENGEKLRFWDQDALNFLLKDRWLAISPKWNLTALYFRNLKMMNANRHREEYADMRVVHFNASLKPWQYRLRHPFKYLYQKNLPVAYSKGFSYPDKTLLSVLRKSTAIVLLFLGLKKF